MSDAPVKVVLDCSNAGAPDPALADAIKQEAFQLFELGEIEKAANVMRQAQETLERSALAVETIVPLDPDELAQRDLDAAAHAEHEAAAQAAADDRAALAAKLSSGKATTAEVQQALAQLLG